jgi:hypothetical protein
MFICEDAYRQITVGATPSKPLWKMKSTRSMWRGLPNVATRPLLGAPTRKRRPLGLACAVSRTVIKHQQVRTSHSNYPKLSVQNSPDNSAASGGYHPVGKPAREWNLKDSPLEPNTLPLKRPLRSSILPILKSAVLCRRCSRWRRISRQRAQRPLYAGK